MSSLQGYDLDIKPMKIVPRKGLCKLSIEAHDRKDEMEEEQLDVEK